MPLPSHFKYCEWHMVPMRRANAMRYKGSNAHIGHVDNGMDQAEDIAVG